MAQSEPKSETSLKTSLLDFSELEDLEPQENILTALTSTSHPCQTFTSNAKPLVALDNHSFTLADLRKIMLSMPRLPKPELPPGLYILSGITVSKLTSPYPEAIFGIPLQEVYHPFVSSRFRLFTTSAKDGPWYDLTRSTVIAIPISDFTDQVTDSPSAS